MPPSDNSCNEMLLKMTGQSLGFVIGGVISTQYAVALYLVGRGYVVLSPAQSDIQSHTDTR